MESNKTYNVTVENDSDITVTVATVATVEISGAPVNVGTGAGISAGILNENLAFRTITTDSNITATQNALDVQLSLSSDLTVDTITSGNIVPLATNTYTLGTPTNVWADLYLGNASLYIDGTKVLGSDLTGDIDFTTDPGQSINIQSGNDVILIPTNAARIESLDVRLGLAVGTGTVTSYGTLNVTGDITRGGTTYRDRAIDFTGGNATVSTDAATYLHLDTPTVYLGSFSNYTTITGSSITGNLTGSVTGTVSSITNHSTDNLAEGANLYYTDARVDARIPTAVSSFVNDVGYITDYTETDPIFTVSPAHGITSQDRTDWAEAYSWGDHSLENYLGPTALTGYATQAYVGQQINSLVDSAPGTLDTLNELAAALGDDPNFATTVTTSIATKLNTADFNPAFDSRLSTKNTGDLTEGTNLYHTTDRARTSISLSSTNTAEMSYDSNTGVFSYVSPTTVTASNAVEMEVRNTTGATIAKGAAVYISGHSGTAVLVELADANAPGKFPAIGLAAGAIPNNTDGLITIQGELAGIDTSAFSTNDIVYLSTTAGVITNVRPSSADHAVQNIGKVARAHGSLGIIIISGSGRANDVPNLDHLEVFIGDTVGYEKRQLEITDLSDVDTTTLTPVNGDVLTWDQTNLEWKPLAAAGGATHIFDLQDVTTGIPGSLQNGSVLQWNSSANEFAPATIQTGATTLDQLSDVTIGSTPIQNGQILRYNSFANDFRPASLPPIPSILTNLNDVQITSTPNNGEALVYDSSINAFIPQLVGGGGGGSLDQVAVDVSYYDGIGQYNRQPASGDVLQWNYNSQSNSSEWLLVPGYTLGGGPLDNATDVSYYDLHSQYGRSPFPGDKLTWGYNNSIGQYEWLLDNQGGGIGDLDNATDVSYFDALSQQPRSPTSGDVLQWNYNTQSNRSEWILTPGYALGGGGGDLDNANDVSYFDVFGQFPRSPNNGDVLQYNYNTQSNRSEWLLVPGSSLGGGGDLDGLNDVQYYSLTQGQYVNNPAIGEILQWSINPSSGIESWLLAPAGGAPTPLDVGNSDVSYIVPGAPPGQPPIQQTSVGDILMWQDDSQGSGFVGWMPSPSSSLGGGGSTSGTLEQVATDVFYPGGPFGINYQDTLNWDGANWIPGFNYNYSDARIKTNITPITGALDKIKGLTGVSYDWSDPKYTGSTIGLTAQNVEQQFPEVVHTGMNDMKQVDYGSLVGALVEAIKEQQEQIEALSTRITQLGG